MLILAVRLGEAVTLQTAQGNVIIRVERLTYSRARLEIEAPKEIRIIRGENPQ